MLYEVGARNRIRFAGFGTCGHDCWFFTVVVLLVYTYYPLGGALCGVGRRTKHFTRQSLTSAASYGDLTVNLQL